MRNLGFYEYLIIFLTIMILLFFTYNIFSRWSNSRCRLWEAYSRDKLSNELELVVSYSQSDYYSELSKFISANQKKIKKRRYSHLLEELLVEKIENNKESASTLRKIASELGFAERSIENLKKKSITYILYGCLQAKHYLCRPAIPYLLEHLKNPVLYLQYDILLALARFDDPHTIVKAFQTIENHILVNERTVRDIINWMSLDNRKILFEEILKLKSNILNTLFLKCIDQKTAQEFVEQFVPMLEDYNPKELKIAAVKATAISKDNTLIPKFIEKLKDSDWEMRAVVARALSNIIDERAIEPLIYAVCDSNWQVRQNAAYTLLMFPNPEIIIYQVIATEDRYACESMRYVCEKNGMYDFIEILEEAMPDVKQHMTIPISYEEETALDIHDYEMQASPVYLT